MPRPPAYVCGLPSGSADHPVTSTLPPRDRTVVRDLRRAQARERLVCSATGPGAVLQAPAAIHCRGPHLPVATTTLGPCGLGITSHWDARSGGTAVIHSGCCSCRDQKCRGCSSSSSPDPSSAPARPMLTSRSSACCSCSACCCCAPALPPAACLASWARPPAPPRRLRCAWCRCAGASELSGAAPLLAAPGCTAGSSRTVSAWAGTTWYACFSDGPGGACPEDPFACTARQRTAALG